LLERRRVEVSLDQQQRAGDDARVLAEEEAADCGDGGECDDEAVCLLTDVLNEGAHRPIGTRCFPVATGAKQSQAATDGRSSET